MLPQLQARNAKLGTTPISVHERSPQDDGTFKVFTDPRDVKLTAAASRDGSPELRGRALIVVYPAVIPSKEMSPPIVGLAIFHPIIPREHQVARFTVRAPVPVMSRKG